LLGDVGLSSFNEKNNCNFTPLWVSVRVLNRTIKQLLSVMENNFEKSKYGVLEIISVKANNLIDCLSKGIYLNSQNTPKAGELKTINVNIYQKLLNTLVDITLVANYDIDSNEIGLLNECTKLLDIIEKEIKPK